MKYFSCQIFRRVAIADTAYDVGIDALKVLFVQHRKLFRILLRSRYREALVRPIR